MELNRRAQIFGALTSLLVHGALFAYIAWRSSTPDLGFDFRLPTEVEFGLSEAVLTTASAPAPPPPEPEPEQRTAASEAGAGSGAAVDAGVPEPEKRADAGSERRSRDAGARDEPKEQERPAKRERERRGVAFLPAGSQIALRLDIARVRASPLAPDVQRLLSAIPDWQALLDGSGIEPLEDLDRLLLASPNLQRSRLIAAGRATGDEGAIRAAAERMAASRGESLEWRQIEGAPVTEWHDRDPTPRVIALVGPRHFVIAREVDVPRVLAVAGARAEGRRSGRSGRRGRQARAERAAEPEPTRAADQEQNQEEENEDAVRPKRRHPADALLSMRAGEGLSLEVEGFRNFAAARPQQRVPIERLPVRLRVGVLELPSGQIGVRIVGEFEDGEQAQAALGHWEPIRQGYASNALVRALGLDPLLTRMVTTVEGDELRVRVDVEVGRMRALLELLYAAFVDRASR